MHKFQTALLSARLMVTLYKRLNEHRKLDQYNVSKPKQFDRPFELGFASYPSDTEFIHIFKSAAG